VIKYKCCCCFFKDTIDSVKWNLPRSEFQALGPDNGKARSPKIVRCLGRMYREVEAERRPVRLAWSGNRQYRSNWRPWSSAASIALSSFYCLLSLSRRWLIPSRRILRSSSTDALIVHPTTTSYSGRPCFSDFSSQRFEKTSRRCTQWIMRWYTRHFAKGLAMRTYQVDLVLLIIHYFINVQMT